MAELADNAAPQPDPHQTIAEALTEAYNRRNKAQQKKC